jgi:hypothetical protein
VKIILQNNFLFLGGLGQLGTGLAKLMRKEFGRENVILSDIIRPSKEILDNGNIELIYLLLLIRNMCFKACELFFNVLMLKYIINLTNYQGK